MATDLADITDLFDPPERHRRKAAARIKVLKDVELPRLTYWNYEPCAHHETPDPHCEYRLCGGEPWRHQRKGVSWLYAVHKGILADETGLGKTAQIIMLTALLKERGELDNRILIVCLASAIDDPWLQDFRRFAPGIWVEAVTGNPQQRRARYAGAWDVMVVSANVFLRDYDVLSQMDWELLVTDDLQPMMHGDTQTSKKVTVMAANAHRVVNINATPIALDLLELYHLSLSVGGRDEFGPLKVFQNRYMRTEPITIVTGSGRSMVRKRVAGYKNMREFKSKFGSFYIRRTYADVDGDVAIPSVAPAENVWLELYPEQRARYRELQEGVVRKLLESGEELRKVNAMTAFGYGQRICASLTNLGIADARESTSVKLDWLEDHILGEWSEEKLVVFAQNKGSIRALHSRLEAHGIGMALIWGETKGDTKRKRELRKAEQERFWRDPNCRVAVGTTAIERSLNLQVARVVVNLDLLLNPQRMVQILGRIRRAGSRHKRVYPFNLLTIDTQEERYLPRLESRAAVADYVLDGKNPLFERLSAVELLHLIRP